MAEEDWVLHLGQRLDGHVQHGHVEETKMGYQQYYMMEGGMRGVCGAKQMGLHGIID